MRCYRVHEFGAASAMQIDTLPDLSVAPAEILVNVKAAGINFPDTLVVAGKYQRLPPLPFVPGIDLAGVVRAVGRDVVDFHVGDRVMAQVEHGAFAEQAIATPDQCYCLPEAMGFEQAAAMGLVYQTAHFALVERGQYRKGETILIGGAAGGIGIAGIQIAKALGARVLAGVRSDSEAAAVQRAGADVVINLAGADLREGLREQVLAATNGSGADVVLDPLGGDFFPAALRAMGWSGRLVVIGFAAGEIPSVKVNYLLVKNISVSGLQWTDYRHRMPQRVREVQSELFELWRADAIRPLITRRFSFEELPEALELVAHGKIQGKAVVIVGDGS